MTEENNSHTVHIDTCSALELVQLINQEDQLVAPAVQRELPRIAEVIDAAAERLRRGGRLFYVGAGTSGRLAAIDAAECPVTYGVSAGTVQAVIPGGDNAFLDLSQENEDDGPAGAAELRRRGVGPADVVVGITASGRTPYVLGAVKEAKQVGALTVALCANPEGPLARLTEFAVTPLTGPEVIQGSTRMKAGTAQKLVLNMLSTGIMIRLGRVYRNRMVGMCVSNEKLLGRAVNMVAELAGVTAAKAAEALDSCRNEIRPALLTLLLPCAPEEAVCLLEQAQGSVSLALQLKQKRKDNG